MPLWRVGSTPTFGTNKNNMAKVWIIGNRTYQKEGFFLQRLKQCRPNTKVQIFELVETSTVGEFQAQQEALKSSNERDLQLKKVLNEVDDNLSNRIKLIEYYRTIATPNDRLITTLEDAKFDEVQFAKVVKSSKVKLAIASTDVEWHVLILSICSFRGYNIPRYYTVKQPELVEEVTQAYEEAKKVLRARKKK